jgi:hypothetical protein
VEDFPLLLIEPFLISIAFFPRYFAISQRFSTRQVLLSTIREGDGKWLVLKELARVIRGLFCGTVQNCHGDAEERHSVTLVHYLTDKDISKVPASNLTTTTV